MCIRMQHTAGGCKFLSNFCHYIWSMTMNELHGVYTYAAHGWWLQIYLCTKSVPVVMVIDELHGSYMYAILSSLTRFKC